MIKTCQAPDSSHVALSSFYVLPSTSLPTPLWRAIALLDCYFMYYCRRQGERIKVSRVSLFFSPHLTCYVPPVMQYLAGRSLGWTTLHFSLQLFQLMRVVSWYQCLTKCWRYMQRERKRRGLMRPPSAPRGQRGSWWAVETMDNSDPRPSLNLISPLRTGPLSCPIFNNHCPLSRRPSQFDQRTQQNASSLDFCIGMLYCRVRIFLSVCIWNPFQCSIIVWKNDRRNSGGTLQKKETKRRQTES